MRRQSERPKKKQRTREVYEGHHSLKMILNPSSRTVSELRRVRDTVWPLFKQIAIDLDSSLSDDKDNSTPVDTRSAIRTALSTPSTFVHILLHQLLPGARIPEEHVNNLYSDFCRFAARESISSHDLSVSVSTSAEFPFLQATLSQLGFLKTRLRDIPSVINQSGIFDSNINAIYIYRIQKRPDCSNSQSLGKKIIVHCPNEEVDVALFPSSAYHYIQVSSENIVRPNGTHPQLHLIVTNDAPKTADIKKLVRNHHKHGRDITRENWVVSSVVYNLFNCLPGLLKELAEKMDKNINSRTKVKRGERRHDNGDGGIFGMGDCRDQHGNVGLYRNIRDEPEHIKYSIDGDAADVMDICVKIAETLFPSLVNFWRLHAIEQSAIPNCVGRLSLAGFGTRRYAGPSHIDTDETRYTLGFRFRRGELEPSSAYHLCLPTAQLANSSLSGIVIEQPCGAIGLWEGAGYEHASTCDIRVKKDKEELGSVGLVLTQKLCLVRQTKRFEKQTEQVADIPRMLVREKMKSRIENEEWNTLMEQYNGHRSAS